MWRQEKSVMIKVCKFGGTSTSDGVNLCRVKEIVESDPCRRYIVVSAPGKRFGNDSKVTDLLYSAHAALEEGGNFHALFQKVRDRFCGIVRESGLNFPIDALLDECEEEIVKEQSRDFTASRGEYLSAKIMAAMLKADFIDARDTVMFFEDGRLNADETYRRMRGALQNKQRVVVAGFYGAYQSGKIKTFSRGGSDVSGAIVARAAKADLYENWTDVSGFFTCDPRIIENPARIPALSYEELRELSYMGANVLHSECIFPVREANIPMRIKNTFRPNDEGTDILPIDRYRFAGKTVTGMAGKRHFTVIYLEKSLMNEEIGFTYRVLEILLKFGISFEHMPSGIDTMSLIIDSALLGRGILEKLCADIKEAVSPDRMHVFEDIALLAVVGHGMTKTVNAGARLLSAIAAAGVSVKMIDQGSSGLNIIVGVEGPEYERTVRAVYREFFEE